eukprot:UN12493
MKNYRLNRDLFFNSIQSKQIAQKITDKIDIFISLCPPHKFNNYIKNRHLNTQKNFKKGTESRTIACPTTATKPPQTTATNACKSLSNYCSIPYKMCNNSSSTP